MDDISRQTISPVTIILKMKFSLTKQWENRPQGFRCLYSLKDVVMATVWKVAKL